MTTIARFRYLLLFVSAALFARIDTVSAAAETTLSKSAFHLSTQSLTAEANAASVFRALRALRTDAVSEGDEERAINIKSIPGLESLKKIPGLDNLKKVSNLFKTKNTPGTYLKWAKKGKSPDYVFLKLKLDKTGYKLFQSADFNVWVAYTRMVSKTDADRTSSDDVFRMMKLDDKADDLLTNPNFNTWAKYLEATKESTGVSTPMINTLRTHFADADLLKAFKAAQANPETKQLGLNLEASLNNIYRLRRMKNGQRRKPVAT
ncbi:hypothetical protein AM587_10003486 [Phytophthora nicotianae]|uniref:RxLR effector protein n=1 Tax=Phytophthora nicotianae TaxID=4792 RepID=A0A0W8D0Z7_PHYNI|nr:hypothetical protein AM587_10003386 [Phytophthora nicotianae]KUF89972.1 hypothetical protein AM587_10003486 [Phytophthora nicotianae]